MINKLREIIMRSDNIVFFGGAGVSTASNIPDFRSSQGLYSNKELTPEIILSHDFFFTNPKDFYQFYKSKMVYKNANPNQAHQVLAKLEEMRKLKAIITQNIDGLHQKAGSENVLELHGSVYRNRCTKCHTFYDLDYILSSDEVPLCSKCCGLIKPEVVLYGEKLDDKVLASAINYIKNADCLIVGGTSLTVYPAAGLVSYYQKNKLILINNSITPYDNVADLVIRENIDIVMSQILKEQ